MRLTILAFLLILQSCSSRKMWVVNNTETGGVVAYQDYSGVTTEAWLKDIKMKVQCPEAFVMGSWHRKSQTSQGAIIVPSTTSNITSVIPTTKEDVWVEHSYKCDWNKISNTKHLSLSKEEQRNIHSRQCGKGSVRDCLLLGIIYKDKFNDPEKSVMIMEKACKMYGDSYSSSKACYFAGSYYHITKSKDLKKASKNFEDGCSYFQDLQDDKNEAAALSCGYLGAYIKNQKLLSIAVDEMQLACIEKNDCYHITCLQSLYGNKEEALKYLKLTFDGGLNEFERVTQDEDLENIRNLPAFKTMIDDYKTRVPASSK
jgi:hypothetical protein